MIPDQVIPIKLAQGVDTKSDPKTVQAGKFLRLENARFGALGSVTKRDGHRALPTAILGGGNLVAPQMIESFKNELVCQDQGQLYAYSPTLQVWVPRGPYVSLGVSSDSISSASVPQILQASCLFGNYEIHTWVQVSANTALSQYDAPLLMTVRDSQSGVDVVSGAYVVDNGYQASGSVTYPPGKPCVLGGTVPAIFYPGTAGGCFGLTLGISSSGVTMGGPILVLGGGQTQPYDHGTTGVFDVAPTATGAVVTVAGVGPLSIRTLNTSLATVNTVQITGLGTIKAVSINVDPTNGNIWVYWTEATNSAYYAVFTSTLSVVLGKTAIATSLGGAFGQICAISNSTTQQTVLYSLANAVTSDSYDIHYGTVTSAGTVGTFNTLVSNLDIYSKPFQESGKTYFSAIYRSKVQGTVFLFCLDAIVPGTVVAKCLSGAAYNTARPGGFIAPALAYSSTKFAFLLPEVMTTDVIFSTSVQVSKSSLITFDFAATDAYQALEANNSLIMNGGIIWEYDGSAPSELGFLLFPEIVASSVTSTGGSLAAGTYEYSAIYQWTDAQGNFHESAPSVLSVTVASGTTNVVNLTVLTPGISMKSTPSTPRLAIYRTKSTGQVGFLAYVVPNIARTTVSVTVAEGNSDSNISGDDGLYTNGGVVENTAPPASLAIALHNNRLWALNSERPNQDWYSKSFQSGVGISMSDLLTVEFDTVGGKGVGQASMDDKLVILAEKTPFVMAGDGFDDTGANSTLTTPQPIPSDSGCTSHRSVISYPGGVLRKTPKGIYRLDRGLNDVYFGMDVEGYNSQSITDALMMGTANEIRFLTSSGLTLVFDYVTGQWATDTNHQGYSACIWNGLYVIARTDGQIHQQAPGYYLDGTTPFAVLAQTSWLTFAGIQGFQRVRRFLALGKFKNGGSANHGVQVSAAYDFGPTFSSPIAYLFGAASASGLIQYRERLPIQKCDAISLLIQEVTTGDSVEFVSLTDLSFEAGIKRGLNKLGQTRSVG
jgi:hypothetical protein